MLKGHLAVALLAAVDDVPGGGDDDEEGDEEDGGFHVEGGLGLTGNEMLSLSLGSIRTHNLQI